MKSMHEKLVVTASLCINLEISKGEKNNGKKENYCRKLENE